MIDMIFALIAASMTSAGNTGQAPIAIAETPVVPQATAPSAVPAAPAVPNAQSNFNMSVVPAGLTADPQTPTGAFTTATEVKPILNATKGNWVALRDYEGQDLLYITHLWSWRCGLKAIAISINGEPMQNWPMPTCHSGTATPNAILPDDGLPYLTLRQGAVREITIQIVYDDLSMDQMQFERAAVLMP